MWNNIKLTTKLYIGFAAVLILLSIVAVISVTSSINVQSMFAKYREIAKTSILLSNFQEDLMEARVASLKFRYTGQDREAKEVAKNINEIYQDYDALKADGLDHSVVEKLANSKQDLKAYEEAFKKVRALRLNRDKLVKKLSNIGPEARKLISQVTNTAYQDGDIVAAYYGGQVNEALLLGRYYSEKFLLDNQQSSKERALKELQEANTRIEELLPQLQNPQRREQTLETSKIIKQYIVALENVFGVITTRNELRKNLDSVAPKMFASYEQVLEEEVAKQRALGARADNIIQGSLYTVIILSLICFVIGLGAALFLGRMFSKGINGVTAKMTALANGNNDVEIFGTDRKDEIGKMAAALRVFQQNAKEVEEFNHIQKEQEEQEKQKRRQEMLALADSFEERVVSLVTSVGQASDKLENAALSLTEAAGQSRQQSATVASASEESSASVRSAAAASEELTAAIKEVLDTITKAASMARKSAELAGTSQQQLDSLNTAIADVDQVISSINDVAEQTNLLALNATIEAARAGEMGKGFAVVASEVKTLANQTKKMTDEIAVKLGAVGESAKGAIDATRIIIQEVRDIDETTSSIAAAMEEQSAAISEISRATQEAASGAVQVSTSIQSVSEAVDRSEQEAGDVRSASEVLSGAADDLENQVQVFLQEVRAA